MKVSIEAHLGEFHAFTSNLNQGLRMIASDRADDFEDRTSDVELVISAESRWRLHTAFGAVRMSVGVVETVWALCAAYWRMYEELKGKSAERGVVVVFADPGLILSMELFRFGIGRLRGEDVRWSAKFPTPSDSSNWVRAANHLTTGSIATYVLHELYHLSVATPLLEISAGGVHDAESSTREERDADAFAAEWLLSGEGGNRSQRILCVSVAALVMTGVWLSVETAPTDPHPSANERLLALLTPYLSDEDPAWAMVCAMLSLHARLANCQFPPGPYDRFKDAVIDMAAAFGATRGTL